VTAPIPLLVPDLPATQALVPYLRQIDENAWYTNNGPLVRAFESRVASFIASPRRPVECVTAASGTVALELVLRALDLPPGSRVLVPAFTFPATVIAVSHAGHQPVLCDVDEHRWVVTPGIAERCAASHDCSAIVPVAAFGLGLDVAAWDEFAERTGLAVVVDGAGALGAMTLGQHVPVAFSLHATKPLGIGEGGVVATCDHGLAQRVRRLANYGFADGCIEHAGTNAKLSEYAAAVGLAQLDRAEALLRRRDNLWEAYRTALARIGSIRVQSGLADRAPANLVVRLPSDAARAAAALARQSIETRRWYCPPIHRHPAFAGLPVAGALEVTEELAQRTLGLPFHTRLGAADIARVVDALDAVC
jgi:dTDP-4-amino-4,6-dideoxygalactose transaminase